MNTLVRRVERYFNAPLGIVRHNGAASTNANEELMALSVCVLATGFLAGYSVNYEIAKRRERNASLELPYSNFSPDIAENREIVNRNPVHGNSLSRWAIFYRTWNG